MKPRRKAGRAPAKRSRRRSAAAGSSRHELAAEIEVQIAEINTSIEKMALREEMDPASLLEIQFQMNLLSQLLETSTNFLAVMHDAMKNAIRNMK